MATDTYAPPDQETVTGLVSGIISDAQTLIQHQVTLVKEEVQAELRKTKEAAVSFAAGVAGTILAAGPLVFMFVALLHELAGWSWWASAGTVALACAIGGGGFIFAGIQRIRSLTPLPKQSMAALKENLQWIKNPK